MTLAWLLLLTGLTISAVAIYYSVIGLAAIFAAAAIPVYIMGTTLEVAKLVCATWLKANWERIPVLMKLYMTTAVVVLMLITSMGIFGFLSKAHLDNNLIGGDVVDKVAIIDEKIKTQRDNIETSRKALLQMDAQVDQILGRSADEKGAERAVQIRRNQAKERTRLQSEISVSQSQIAKLNEERAPIAKDLRKVEAEVGPIKYIAKLVYGDDPDANLLEKAVTWVIIVIVIVFDPLAVIMLLAAQMTFQWHRRKDDEVVVDNKEPTYERDDGPLTNDQLAQIKASAEGNSLTTESNQDIVKEATVTARFVDHGEHPKDNYGYEHTETEVPSETPSTALGGDITAPEEPVVPGTTESELEKWNNMLAEAERAVQNENVQSTVEERVARGETFIDGAGKEVTLEADFPEPSKKKTYMTKDDLGTLLIKEKK
jgi:hypothetical protein